MSDEMITELDAVTSLVDADLLTVVTDVSTAPVNKKITWANIKATLKTYFDTLYAAIGGAGIVSGPNAFMDNGVITVSVASNNLTVAIKTIAGADPSAGDPVKVRIGDTYRSITAALSVTTNAGTNWCNAGSTELATYEIDYFVYLGYNATDGVTIGFSRIHYANLYSDFSATSTDLTYCAISTITNAAAGDNYVNVGRFAATLSAGAGYTWTVPAFTSDNLIQRPIYSTRVLDFNSVITYSGGSTNPTSNTVAVAQYVFNQYIKSIAIRSVLVKGAGDRTSTRFSIPISIGTSAINTMVSITAGGLGTVAKTYVSGTVVYVNETMANDGSYYITIHTIL